MCYFRTDQLKYFKPLPSMLTGPQLPHNPYTQRSQLQVNNNNSAYRTHDAKQQQCKMDEDEEVL